MIYPLTLSHFTPTEYFCVEKLIIIFGVSYNSTKSAIAVAVCENNNLWLSLSNNPPPPLYVA